MNSTSRLTHVESMRLGNFSGKSCALALTCVMAVGSLATRAQIRTDGSLGPAAQSLNGPSYLIPQSLGKLSGTNLFHSFETFNLSSGQTANFTTTTSGLTNVISRVSGGQVSNIDGLIRLTSAGASPHFHLINPSGVVFGSGAAVDVPASFNVSTADYMRMDGNTLFFADRSRSSTFSSASPSAFGFLGSTRSGITIKDGAQISSAPGSSIRFAAGDIVIDGASVSTTAADIRMAAVGSIPYEVTLMGPPSASTGGNIVVNNGAQVATYDEFDVDKPVGNLFLSGQNISLETNAQLLSAAYFGSNDSGAIDLLASGTLKMDNALVDASSYAGGSGGVIRIHAGDVSAINSVVSSTSYFGNGASGSLKIVADRNISLSGSRISTQTLTDANAGSISLQAGDVTISGAFVTSSSIAGAGNAGDISLMASGTVDILGPGAIDASTFAPGGAGDITVTARDLNIAGYGKIDSSSGLASAGKAGNVSVVVPGKLSITDFGFIVSDTNSSFDAGTISVNAGNVILNHSGRISSTSSLPTSWGNSGNIFINADKLSFSDGGLVTTSTFSQGNGGATVVKANNIVVNGEGINSIAYASGSAGSIDVRAKESITITSGGFSSNTYGPGRAGSVEVQATDILMDGAKSLVSALSIAGIEQSSTKTGRIGVSAGKSLTLRNGALISLGNYASSSDPNAPANNAIVVSAPNLMLDSAQITSESFGNVAASPISVSVTNKATLVNGASISTAANLGNGGAIELVGAKTLVLDSSQVTTSVRGAIGNGGNISISSDALILKSGFVQANTAAVGAAGGLVTITVPSLLASGNTLFAGGSTPLPFQPSVFGFNVIQAAAPTGLTGVINITSPVLDLSGGLRTVDTPLLKNMSLGRNPCQTSAGSTLAPGGRGGLAPSAQGLLDGSSFGGNMAGANGSSIESLDSTIVALYAIEGWGCQ